MSLFQKLKGIRKRWYFLALLVIIIGVVGVRFAYHHEKADSELGQLQYQQVCTDLLYLENFPTLKISPDEAKAILPMFDRLVSSNDSNLQMELAKQIYGQLTPQQYSTLTDQQKNSRDEGRNKESKDEHGKGEKDFFKKGNDPRSQAAGSVLQKMLTDRSAGKL